VGETSTRELSRLRWRCRRGMRELDELLLRYVERRLPQATHCERDAFACLLELPDPELFACIVGRTTARDSAQSRIFQDVIAQIRSNEP
jgi:antitoxin CptB